MSSVSQPLSNACRTLGQELDGDRPSTHARCDDGRRSEARERVENDIAFVRVGAKDVLDESFAELNVVDDAWGLAEEVLSAEGQAWFHELMVADAQPVPGRSD